MQYREFGNTGLKVSEIGLGCEGFAGKDEAFAVSLMDRAIEAGVNFVDIYTSDPEVRSHIGAALKGRREGFIIEGHVCSIWTDGQYKCSRKLDECEAAFADLLERLGTDHIEIGMIHYVDTPEEVDRIVDGPLFPWLKELKAEGKIGHIGMSSHNPAAALRAIERGLIEVLLFSTNPCYDLLPGTDDVEQLWNPDNYSAVLTNMDPERQQLYETCSREGIGISVMKAFGGGDLLDDKLSPAGKALTPAQCLHYALTRPAVSVIACGAHSLDELESSLAYESATDEERDYAAALASFPRINWKGHCMYCGHCAPCPKKIDIASVTKFLNLAKAQGCVPETVREHYKALPHHASECQQCRACELRCPFGVEVTANMREAYKIFGL